MNVYQFLYRMHIRSAFFYYILNFSRRMKRQRPPIKIQKKIINCLKLYTFFDRAEQDLLEYIFTLLLR